MGKYLSIDECPDGGEVQLIYSVNGKVKDLRSTVPLLVKVGKTVPPKTKVFIDDSGSMWDIHSDILAAVEKSIFGSYDISYPYDERWILWLKQTLTSSDESLALIFIDESSPYLYENNWRNDLEDFLAVWTPEPRSYAHLFIVNDEGDYSSKLIRQVVDAFFSLSVTGYSFSVNSPSSIAESIQRKGGGTSGYSAPQNNPQKPVSVKGPIRQFLDTIEGGYVAEVFSAPSFNVADILTMKANNQPIPDWMFRGPILTERSNQAIDVEFRCNERCPVGSFEIVSNDPPECFPYQIAIDSIKEINSYFAQLEEWKL